MDYGDDHRYDSERMNNEQCPDLQQGRLKGISEDQRCRDDVEEALEGAARVMNGTRFSLDSENHLQLNEAIREILWEEQVIILLALASFRRLSSPSMIFSKLLN